LKAYKGRQQAIQVVQERRKHRTRPKQYSCGTSFSLQQQYLGGSAASNCDWELHSKRKISKSKTFWLGDNH